MLKSEIILPLAIILAFIIASNESIPMIIIKGLLELVLMGGLWVIIAVIDDVRKNKNGR